MADVQRNVHVRAQAPDVVIIQHLGILAPQHTALAARLAIVQAPPGVEHIGTALGFGGVCNVRWRHLRYVFQGYGRTGPRGGKYRKR